MEATTIVIESSQLDMLVTFALGLTMSICFCLGWLCHELGGK